MIFHPFCIATHCLSSWKENKNPNSVNNHRRLIVFGYRVLNSCLQCMLKTVRIFCQISRSSLLHLRRPSHPLKLYGSLTDEFITVHPIGGTIYRPLWMEATSLWRWHNVSIKCIPACSMFSQLFKPISSLVCKYAAELPWCIPEWMYVMVHMVPWCSVGEMPTYIGTVFALHFSVVRSGSWQFQHFWSTS